MRGCLVKARQLSYVCVNLETVDETTSNALFCSQNLALISLATAGPQALTDYYYLDFIVPHS